MAGHVCPWWLAPFTIDGPFRRWLHNPARIVGPYIRPGMTVVDVGCGVGYFSVPMARMVGDQGRVVAVDLQLRMLDMLRRRADRAGVTDRVEMRRCQADRLGLDIEADFATLFAVLHEVPDQRRLLAELHDCLKPRGVLLLAEPPLHVSRKALAAEAATAEEVGFKTIDHPAIRWARAVLFERGE